MMCFWARIVRQMRGKLAITEPANTLFQNIQASLRKLAIPTVMG
jgi:hypothetical protein